MLTLLSCTLERELNAAKAELAELKKQSGLTPERISPLPSNGHHHEAHPTGETIGEENCLTSEKKLQLCNARRQSYPYEPY